MGQRPQERDDLQRPALGTDGSRSRLATAVAELKADVIAVPPFSRSHLEAGHAVHFRLITRLLEADYAAYGPRADSRRTAFWLRELRTPSILIDVVRSAADASTSLVPERPLLAAASAGPPPRAARWRLASFLAVGRVTSRSRKASARDVDGPVPRACDLRPSLRRTRPCGGTFRSGRRQATPPASPPVPEASAPDRS